MINEIIIIELINKNQDFKEVYNSNMIKLKGKFYKLMLIRDC